MESAYQAARAQYDQAIDARDRLKKVYDAGSLPEIKWVEANSNVSQAEANRNHYKKSLENCELRAPSDGFIGSRNIEVGMSAVQIQAPIEIVHINSVYAKISVPESEISLFEIGQDATLHVSALNNTSYTGQVEKIGVMANRLSRTYDVKIEVKNPGLKLKPGMVCEVKVMLPLSNPVLLVPMSAVESDANNKPFAFTVDRNTKKAIKKTICIANIVDNKIAVSSGLEADELVIIAGNQKVSDNAQVNW
jgi:RND family efflux transporter MFP subunit